MSNRPFLEEGLWTDRRRMTIRNQSKLAGASPEFGLIYIPGGGTAAIEAMRTKFNGNISTF